MDIPLTLIGIASALGFNDQFDVTAIGTYNQFNPHFSEVN